MDDPQLQSIYNYRRISDRIDTSGMPSEEELAGIARAGFQGVINLDQLDSHYELPDERKTVESLGMTYLQIPVLWEQPAHENLVSFFAAMEQYAGERVFVHCVANARVSTFMALYRVLRLGWTYEDAVQGIYSIWQPNPTWQQFIESELNR